MFQFKDGIKVKPKRRGPGQMMRCDFGIRAVFKHVASLPLVSLLKCAGTFLADPTAGIAAKQSTLRGVKPAPPLAWSIGSWTGRKGWGQLQQFHYYPTPSCCLLKIGPAYVYMLLPVLPSIKQVLFEALRSRREEREECICSFCIPSLIPFICRLPTLNLKLNPFNLIYCLWSWKMSEYTVASNC